MKKIVNIITMILIIILCSLININVYATDANVKTEIQQQTIEENQLEVVVSMSELENIGQGINAYSGILNFDTDELEFVSISNGENWNNPVYNEEEIENGKLKVVATSNDFINQGGVLFTLTFNIKQVKEEYNINFEEFEVAAKIDGETVKVSEGSIAENTETAIPETNNSQNNDNAETKQINNTNLVIAIICGVIIILVLIFGFWSSKKNKEEN